jgi:uncharacterized protein (DUF427 family)
MNSRPEPLLTGPVRESVWAYPSPPVVEPTGRRVRVIVGGATIVDTTNALRVLENGHPPTYYVPVAEVIPGALLPSTTMTFSESRGQAHYFSVVGCGRWKNDAAWYYPDPAAGYEALLGYVAFYPLLVDAAYLDEERVRPQLSDYYGGWITSDIVGPFKGEDGADWK